MPTLQQNGQAGVCNNWQICMANGQCKVGHHLYWLPVDTPPAKQANDNPCLLRHYVHSKYSLSKQQVPKHNLLLTCCHKLHQTHDTQTIQWSIDLECHFTCQWWTDSIADIDNQAAWNRLFLSTWQIVYVNCTCPSIGLLVQALCFSTYGRHAPVLDLCGAWVLLSVNVVDIHGLNNQLLNLWLHPGGHKRCQVEPTCSFSLIHLEQDELWHVWKAFRPYLGLQSSWRMSLISW